ncbi:hypothetical protein ACHAXS_011421 [Conticribra weissflogii]
MAPNSFFAGDCHAIGMGQLFDALLATSINSVCVDSVVPAGPRVYSPTYQDAMKKGRSPTSNCASVQHVPNMPRSGLSPSGFNEGHLDKYSDNDESEPMMNPHHSLSRPPLHQPAPRPSFRNRKKPGLSIQPPSSPSDRHESPDVPPIYCAKNVEMRRKSLSERHFFRPVSEDDESTASP